MLLRLLVSLLAPAAALAAAPVHERSLEVVPGSWIVQLKSGVDPSTIQAHQNTARAIHRRHSRRNDGGIKKTYRIGDFNAYSADFDEVTAAEIALLPEVLAVTGDGIKHTGPKYVVDRSCGKDSIKYETVYEYESMSKSEAEYEVETKYQYETKYETKYETTPTNDKTTPTSYTTSPTSSGANPPGYGANPPDHGPYPPVNETYPPNPTHGTYPPINSTYPPYPTHGPYPPTNGTTPPVNGTYPPVNGTTPPVNGTNPPTNVTLNLLTQDPAPWALGSISHREPGFTEYVYDSTAGQGNYVYVLDTGIRLTHVDFEGRASFGYNAAGGSNEPVVEHGTSVASHAVGKTYGVAKKAQVIDVKVFDDKSSTTDSIILDGFNWAVDDIIAKNRVKVSVINMSLGGARTANSPWDAAIQNAFDLGILVVVAAGNENTNASTRSPASAPAALTVGNINKDNVRHNDYPGYGSNYGPAVKIFAPGVSVTGASVLSDTATVDTTGTSDSTPHVAGLACYLRGLYGPSSAKEVTQRILGLATKDVVVDPKGSANLLAYNGSGK